MMNLCVLTLYPIFIRVQYGQTIGDRTALKRTNSFTICSGESKKRKRNSTVNDTGRTVEKHDESMKLAKVSDDGSSRQNNGSGSPDIGMTKRNGNVPNIPKNHGKTKTPEDDDVHAKRKRIRRRRGHQAGTKLSSADIAVPDSGDGDSKLSSAIAPISTEVSPRSFAKQSCNHKRLDSGSEKEIDNIATFASSKNTARNQHTSKMPPTDNFFETKTSHVSLDSNSYDRSQHIDIHRETVLDHDAFHQGFVSSKVVHHVNQNGTPAQVIGGVQVFNRRRQKKKANFPFSEATTISSSDRYTNKSHVYQVNK